MNKKRLCFVIMPFRADLHYFYLFLKQHVEQHHQIECERGDGQVLTKPIIEKINDHIRQADVIVADCSGRNPNVFYELGLAHAYDKKVILITHDDVKDAPADIRHYEFIQYRFDQHHEFLDRLDNALNNVFAVHYENLHEKAMEVFAEFCQTTSVKFTQASKEKFLQQVRSVPDRQVPSLDDEIGLAEFLLPRIILDVHDAAVMKLITDWLSTKKAGS